MSDFEDLVRRALRTDVPGVEAEQLLVDVRRGATRRRRGRVIGAIAASVLVIAGAAGVATSIRGDEGTLPEPPPATRTPSPSPTQPALPEGAAQGVIDVSVVSTDRWFRLTTNVGCVACSTVWQNDQSAEGGWERLYDFEGTTADYGGTVDPAFGPVGYLVMAANGQDGWAWGSRLRSTHDGGRTWSVITTGPGHGEGGSFEVGITNQFAWSLRRTPDAKTELWRSSLQSDSWSRADAPDMSGVSGMVTFGDEVALETSDEGLAAPRIQYSRDGTTWGELANPCEGENQIYPATSLGFILCPDGSRATVYRMTGVEHQELDLTGWDVFGRTTGTVTNFVPVGDSRVLIVGDRRRATLMTEDGPTPVDLGLRPDEETFQSSCAQGLCFLTTSSNRLLGSDDSGRTWHEVE